MAFFLSTVFGKNEIAKKYPPFLDFIRPYAKFPPSFKIRYNWRKKMSPKKNNKKPAKKILKKTVKKATVAKNKSLVNKKKKDVSKKLKSAKSAKNAKLNVLKKSLSKVSERVKIAKNPAFLKKTPKFSGQKKVFYDLLIKMRENLMGQVKILSEEALTTGAAKGEHSSSMANHLADFGSDNFLHNMELDIMTGEMEDIEMIDEAIERLFNGEYGKCLECGCQIPNSRLKVKPHARFCVRCKSKHEAEAKKIELER